MTRPTKKRRTKKEINLIRSALYEILAEDHPQTVRGVFYQMTTRGVVDKTETDYKGTVVRLLGKMRDEGALPYAWIVDNTRWMRKPDTYPSLESALRSTCQYYRRAIWHDLPSYVEVWLEKEALSGVIYEETEKWDVPLMVTRGFSSKTFLYESGLHIKALNKKTYIYHMGDFDPSGVDIGRTIENDLRKHAPEVEIHFKRIAVNPERIKEWNLPTRPTKKLIRGQKNLKAIASSWMQSLQKN